MDIKEGCDREIQIKVYSIFGTSELLSSRCGWFTGKGKEKHYCSECYKEG